MTAGTILSHLSQVGKRSLRNKSGSVVASGGLWCGLKCPCGRKQFKEWFKGFKVLGGEAGDRQDPWPSAQGNARLRGACRGVMCCRGPVPVWWGCWWAGDLCVCGDDTTQGRCRSWAQHSQQCTGDNSHCAVLEAAPGVPLLKQGLWACFKARLLCQWLWDQTGARCVAWVFCKQLNCNLCQHDCSYSQVMTIKWSATFNDQYLIF